MSESEEKSSSVRISLPSSRSIAIAIVVVAVGFLVAQMALPLLKGQIANPVVPETQENVSNNGDVETTIALLAAFGGILLFIFGQFWSQLNNLNQQFSTLASSTDQKIREQIELQAESAAGRYERLTSRIENISDQYPWLGDFDDLGVVTNVKTSSAVLDTFSSLLSSNQENYAYEWLVESSSDSDLSGSAANFLGLAIISNVLYRDEHLTQRFLRKIDSHRVPTWENAIIISDLRSGNFLRSSTIAEGVEKRILANRITKWIKQKFIKSRSRYEDAIPSETVGTLLHYYSTVGDSFAQRNIVPKIKKAVGEETLSQAKIIKAALDSNSLGPLEGMTLSVQGRSLLVLLQVELELYKLAYEAQTTKQHAIILYDLILQMTGNRQLAKAFDVVGLRLLDEKRKRYERSSSNDHEVMSTAEARTHYEDSVGREHEDHAWSISTHWKSVAESERRSSEEDPVWGGSWKPAGKEKRPDFVHLGGVLPEKEAAETLVKNAKARKKVIESVQGFRVFANEEILSIYEERKVDAIKALNKKDRLANSDSSSSEQIVSLRALDVTLDEWVSSDDPKLAEAVENHFPQLSGFIDAGGVLETSVVSWTNCYLLVRLKNDEWSPKSTRVYFLFGLSEEISGRIFDLNGGSSGIHEANSKSKLELGGGSAIDYLRFFCFFVRGENGPFHIIETKEDFMWPIDLDSTQEERAIEAIRPVDIIADKDNSLLLGATLYYGSAIFQGIFEVKADGKINLIDDTPLVENLPNLILPPITIMSQSDADGEI